jgi:hypothetical protein
LDVVVSSSLLVSEDCKDFFGKSLFVVGEFGGNDYNAPLFAGKDLRDAYRLMPHVVQGISDGVEVTFSSLLVASVSACGFVLILCA